MKKTDNENEAESQKWFNLSFSLLPTENMLKIAIPFIRYSQKQLDNLYFA